MPQTSADFAAARLQPWLSGILLPFWASAGFDAAHGAFVEKFEVGRGWFIERFYLGWRTVALVGPFAEELDHFFLWIQLAHHHESVSFFPGTDV